MALVEDDNAEHEIRIRLLGNSGIYVTCKCMDLKRARWKGRTINSRPSSVKIRPEWKSLGDFPVGTPTPKLIEAFESHLKEVA